MAIIMRPFGTTDNGEKVSLFTIDNGNGCIAELLDYGCILRALIVPGRGDRPVDVTLGYDDIEGYQSHSGNYFGAVVGRYANRIGKSSFTLNGCEYKLAANNGENHLHGGLRGFNKYVWEATQLSLNSLSFSRISPDGEEGYPGNLRLQVTYTVEESNVLRIDYSAICDADTVVNLTNHSYFNLSGQGTVLDHLLKINAESFTENDSGCLPTGKIIPVEGTPFDFRKPCPIGDGIKSDYPQIAMFNGYDHNFCLEGSGLRSVAKLISPRSGIAMETLTTKPGLQLYTSCGLEEHTGKGGARYGQYSGVCLETQFYPNSMRCPNFLSPVLQAGKRYNHTTAYSFTID